MNTAQIYQLIPRVMAEVGAIEKGRKNTQQNYAFRGIDDVFAAFQGPLAKHQIFYVPEVLERAVTERQTLKGGTLIYTTLMVAYTFYAPDGSSVRAVVVGEAMDSGDKSSNKAMSAALKYALLQVFCVPVEAQEDADYESHEVRPRQPQASATITEDQSKTLNNLINTLMDDGVTQKQIADGIAAVADGIRSTHLLSNEQAAKVIQAFNRRLDVRTAEKEAIGK